jgi:hypothetical protein
MEVSGQLHTPAAFNPVTVLGYYRLRGWVDLKACLDAVRKRKNSHHCPCREMNPQGRPARSLVAILAELSRLQPFTVRRPHTHTHTVTHYFETCAM